MKAYERLLKYVKFNTQSSDKPQEAAPKASKKTETPAAPLDLNEIGSVIKDKLAELNRTLPSFKQVRGLEMRRTEFEKNTSKKIIRYKIK